VEHQEIDEPVLLEPTNFTPPARTPWGGRRIRALKGLPAGPPVGESWELSIEPSFPSALADGRRLDALAPGCALLVKLLDAEDALSVQIHPSDDDPTLGPDEAGKPEAWYVIDRAPGAGLWIGLAEGADEARMRACLDEGGDLSALLPFVPVEPGDFFSIEAGTPHCIGPGVFLVEPQRVSPGKRGLTYRYWDWNRTYDAAGRRDPSGQPRALHVEDALRVTRWDLPRGEALLDRVRVRAGAPARDGRPALRVLAEGPPLSVARLAGDGALDLPARPTLSALTVLAGAVELASIRVEAGRTAALPAGWSGPARLHAAHAMVSST